MDKPNDDGMADARVVNLATRYGLTKSDAELYVRPIAGDPDRAVRVARSLARRRSVQAAQDLGAMK